MSDLPHVKLHSGALRAQVIYSPLLTLLSAIVIAPFLAQVAISPLLHQPKNPTDYSAYHFNEWLYRIALASVVFGAGGITTWVLSKLEGASQTVILTHLRQCSLIYVYVAFSIVVAMQDIECYVCPAPWTWIAPSALFANVLTLVLLAERKVAA